ncbi:MAG: class I SAM-dependent methyltransferase [Elusimicrobiota bacterium]|nr:class I SAM-dependent methyltransferase [Elusimicrobiota bacterium]
MKPDFKREQIWWEGKADGEERDIADEPINRALRWRAIDRSLQGIKTIAEVGAATGTFTIPLAKRGYKVTHIDFSAPAIALAKKKAKGLKNIEFVLANAADLHMFPNKAFDLVLNMDGAVSFCGKDATKSIKESCRICRKRLLITASNKAWLIPVWVATTFPKFKKIVPAVKSMIKDGFWHYDQHPHNKKIIPGYFGTLKAFLPSELAALIKANGLNVKRCQALGSLANLAGKDTVDFVKQNHRAMETFLDLCEDFDQNIMPCGPGTKQRAGLIAIAERR